MSNARNLAELLESDGDVKSNALGNAPNPITAGTVAYLAMNTAPTGWVKANGAALSRATYADLFNAIGTTYGSGDGSTTFNLPDLRGEFPRGWDDGRGADSGRNIGSYQTSQNLEHNHPVMTAPHTGNFHYANGQACFNRGYPNNLAGNYAHQVSVTRDGTMPTGLLTAADRGGDEARPRNIALLACIKY